MTLKVSHECVLGSAGARWMPTRSGKETLHAAVKYSIALGENLGPCRAGTKYYITITHVTEILYATMKRSIALGVHLAHSEREQVSYNTSERNDIDSIS